MNVKRFVSSSMQDALKKVREEFGADAVILSNEKVNGGVEIVAALDYDEQQAQVSVGVSDQVSPSRVARLHAEKHLRLQDELGRAREHIAQVKRKQSESAHHSEVRVGRDAASDQSESARGWDQLSDMRAEIESLKGLITQQVASGPQQMRPAMTLAQQHAKKKLDALGIMASVQERLMASIKQDASPEESWQQVSDRIEQGIEVEFGEIIDHGGVIALVGPTGSGKTMTIGKLAARYVMKFGADSIALVTTDRYRIAAHEQLKVFGRILNVPVHSVDEQNTLDSILDRLSGKKLVLVDTAGLLPSDKSWDQQLRELKMSAHRVQPYLVMSSVGQYQVMCANYHHYKMVNLSGVILSKLDEAVSLGESISFLLETGLRVAYYTNGQRVPEDIHRMDKKGLLEQAEALLNSSERWVTIHSRDVGGVSESVVSHSA
ncbi:MAG: flagellar biosynthesis protein FlhF [Oleiphilus sp.]|nr:MAG: flagellar biosynthesis protein FlhF [Oleiphilus sp.]